MHPKLQKKDKKSTELFEGSAIYSTSEPSLAQPFFRFRTAKKDFGAKIKGDSKVSTLFRKSILSMINIYVGN